MSKKLQFNDTTQISVNAEIIDSEIDDEVVMMDVQSGAYFGLNDIASIIWNQIKSPTTYKELIDYLVQEYDVSAEQCKLDVVSLLSSMHEQKLVTVTQ